VEKTYKYFKYDVLYPFGWGISYTKFQFQWTQGSKCNLPNGLLYCITVFNRGNLQGTETIFVFVIPPSTIPLNESVSTMKKHLVDWTKVEISSLQSYNYQFTLNTTKSLSLSNNNGDEVIFTGTYTLLFSNGVDQNLEAYYTVNTSMIIEEFPKRKS